MRRWIIAAIILGFVLAHVAACKTEPAPNPHKLDDSQVYRQCVGSDHSKQDLCQRHVYGETFSDDDPRWDCTHMGNWLCSDAERKL